MPTNSECTAVGPAVAVTFVWAVAVVAQLVWVWAPLAALWRIWPPRTLLEPLTLAATSSLLSAIEPDSSCSPTAVLPAVSVVEPLAAVAEHIAVVAVVVVEQLVVVVVVVASPHIERQLASAVAVVVVV